MIFVTVGAQMPFDRLVSSVDRWAGEQGRTDVFAQIGNTPLEPEHMKFARFLSPEDFGRLVQEADAIIGHAGMGTIITALDLRKPLLVMPRRGDLRETRNDHQIATARRFEERGWISVAYGEQELPLALEKFLASARGAAPLPLHASPDLISTLRRFASEVQSAKLLSRVTQ